MHLYRIGGALLRSDLQLPSLVPAAPAPDGPSLALRAASAPFGEPERWLYTERFEETSAPWRAVGILGGQYLVRLFGHADFLLDRAERSARVHVAPGAAAFTVEPLFLEQVMPLLWSLVGVPCLHASAVAWGEGEAVRAAAFAGRSRSGKSTLAGSLAAATSALLADDCTVIELAGDHVLAHPGHRSVRLLADAAEALFASATAGETSIDGAKRRLDLRGGSRALPLARIYLLEEAAAEVPRITPVRPRDAVALLAGCLFRIDPEDRSRLAGELALLEAVAERTIVARLAVPRRFEALPAVRAAIAEDLGQ